ncbi:MAG: TRC40/GET3/ArsA family transport-energizing ATPase [Acidobacteriota bacterium]|jgi:arsenite/tail-anchored protein-transporting ATPase
MLLNHDPGLRNDPGVLGPLLERRFLFVGGKGGVGKSTTASALALAAADRGRKCLLVSTDPAHSLGDLFERKIGPRRRKLEENLRALELDANRLADAYIEKVQDNLREVTHPSLYPEINRQMQMARLAPGTHEAALMDALAGLMGEEAEEFDSVIFDTAPSGHTLRLLSLPDVMAAWTDGMLRSREKTGQLQEAAQSFKDQGEGPDRRTNEPRLDGGKTARIRQILEERQRKFRRAGRLLRDPASSSFILVLTPEKLPIQESAAARDALGNAGIPVEALVVNRLLPSSVSDPFLQRRREQESARLKDMERLFHHLPRAFLPLQESDISGAASLLETGRFLLGG